jgi:hypothetical protein
VAGLVGNGQRKLVVNPFRFTTSWTRKLEIHSEALALRLELEVELQRELDDAAVGVCSDGSASGSESGIAEGYVRISPLRMVEQIEEFATELEIDVLV